MFYSFKAILSHFGPRPKGKPQTLNRKQYQKLKIKLPNKNDSYLDVLVIGAWCFEFV